MTVIVTSAEELERIVANAVAKALAEKREAPSEWCDRGEVASMMGVKPDHVRRLDLERFGSRKVPRYRRADVLALMAKKSA